MRSCSVSISPLSLLGNGSVNTSPRQRIQTQRGVVGGVVLYVVDVLSMDSRRLVLPRTYCFIQSVSFMQQDAEMYYRVSDFFRIKSIEKGI
jgi:hypothetical protein